MCFHKQSKATAEQLEKYYNAVNRYTDYQPNYYENGYDHQASPILTIERKKELVPAIWGFVPTNVKSTATARTIWNTTLNAISEEMYEKPTYQKSANASLRCLIPCTGFFEWHTGADGKTKTMHIVHVKDQPIFSIAGIYNHWHHPDLGEEVLTYSLLTTAANKQMSWLHNSKKRQPAYIPKQYEMDYLNGNLSPADVIEICRSHSDDNFSYYSISNMFSGNKLSSSEKNIPDIEKPVEYSPEEMEGKPKEPKEKKEPKSKKAKPDNGQASLF